MALRIISYMVLALIWSGCSMFDEEVEIVYTPEQLYAAGVAGMKNNEYLVGKRKFEALDHKHPFSKLATPAQLNLIYANFKLGEYDDTVSAAERFIRLHPRHKHVSYAFYMRGISNYRQISNANLDQDQARKALSAFRELVARFPQSDYAWQAKQMIVLCLDRLAEQEMVVARFYLDRSEYIAALNRFDEVIKNPEYKNTSYFEEALFSMVLASYHLGLKVEARNYSVVLGHNYSDGQYYPLALKILEGKSKVTKWDLSKMRKPVEDGDNISRLFQGLAPGLMY
ncbi:MAG: outer membrane protein assembly factor BamD [Magnetococcales bacterium]|nr:outer membrane protein assembly factor BamD [Magnetococcales bacterium]